MNSSHIYDPAGRLCQVGDLVAIMAFGLEKIDERFTTKVLVMDNHNQVRQTK